MKRVYYSKIINNPTDIARRKIEQQEKKTLIKMEIRKKQYVTILQNPIKKLLKKRGERTVLAQGTKLMNPLSTFLYSRLSFSLWKKYCELTFIKLKKEDFFESDSSEDEENEYSLNNLSSSISDISSKEDQENKHFTSAIASIKSVSFQQKPEKHAIFELKSQEFALPHEVLERKEPENY